jgi:Papain family cysteine protease
MEGQDRRSSEAARTIRKFRLRPAIGAMAAVALALLMPGAGTVSAKTAVKLTSHGMGLIKTKPAPVSAKQSATIRAQAAALPTSVDLTPYAMPVGNQGDVGSCAAWATDYSALGYWENKQGLSALALEPMYTYSQVTGGYDVGSTIEGNLQIDEQGIDNQADYWQGNFDYWDMPSAPEKAHAVNWKLSGFADLAIQPSSTSTLTQQSIEAALAAGKPVVIGIPVYYNFFEVGTASQGYYAGPSGPFEGNHAITALGYNPNGLVIENSWGTSWGNKGYATLSWSFVNGYVFDAVSVSSLHTGQPVSTAAPVISGSAREGVKLTASAGTWSPAATSYAYQWQRAGSGSAEWANIAGATASSYTPVAADLAQNLRVLVTAANGSGSGAANSATAGPVGSGTPVNTTAPSITGTLRVGQSLTAAIGTWSPEASSYAYQWQRSTNSGSTWTNISGATGASYVTAAADANAYLRVQVTGTNPYGSAVASAAKVGPVSGAPFNTVAPAVTGTAARGSALQAGVGTWSPAPTSYAYQWQRLASGSSTWASIAGATTATYTPAKTDENAKLRVQVTGTNAYGVLAVTSAATAAISASPPLNTVAPKVSGTAGIGRVLSASLGSWSGQGNVYSYQWQRSSGGAWSAIAGATGATYTQASGDVGYSLRVVVTAVNPDGSLAVASAGTVKVPKS